MRLEHTIVDEGDHKRAAVPLAVVFGLVVVVGLGLLLVRDVGANIVGLVLAIIGGLLLLIPRRMLRIRRRLEPGVLELPHPTFTLGSDVPARFRRTVKEGTTDTTVLQAHLVHTEWVRYTVGTDTRTEQRELQRIDIPVTRAYDGSAVVGDLVLTIPPYPPSFVASDNKVTWTLHVEMEFTDGFREDSSFPLWVVPAIHAADVPEGWA